MLDRFIFIIQVDTVEKNATDEMITIREDIRKQTVKKNLDHKNKEMTSVEEK